MRKILLLDHQDAFMYSMLRMLEKYKQVEVQHMLTNKLDINILDQFDGLILSSGAGLAEEADIFLKSIAHCFQTHKILGIGLGFHAIVSFFGGSTLAMPYIRHGHKATLKITDTKDALLTHIDKHAQVGIYQSRIIDSSTIPNCLNISSMDEEQQIMSVYHESLPIHGLQFHPESIITNCGHQIMEAFVSL